MLSDFLLEAAAASVRRCARAKAAVPEGELSFPGTPPTTFDPARFHLIGEVKRQSPAEGTLTSGDLAIGGLARAYAQAGASAVSVLTEPDRFAGSLEDLATVSGTVPIPVMRKDFLVDPYQVREARAHGARGVLVIVRIAAGQHHAMIDAAAETNSFLLLEAFDRHDLDQAAALAERADTKGVTTLVGVNCRDLSTLRVDPLRFESLAGHLPAGRIVVAESGMRTPGDIRAVAGLGYRGALVGTALMRAPDPAQLMKEMFAAGSAGVTSCA